ncbi:MAG TPA: hypothetical protein VK698_19685 [Kofleriaceae bacterium]|nr:hypothetical protein [Kofleriaceae bacterium]
MARQSRLHRFLVLGLAVLVPAWAGGAACGGNTGDGGTRSAPASGSAAGTAADGDSLGGDGGGGDGADDGGGVAASAARVGPAVVRDSLAAAGAARLILFAGQAAPAAGPRAAAAGQAAPVARLSPVAPLSIDPALPRGLRLDASSGAITGASLEPAAGRVHLLRDARGATSTVWVEILPAPSPRTSRFVSPSGNDSSPGSIDRPFRTVGRAVRDLGPGMTLFLRRGVYRESVELRRLTGTAAQPIEIRSYPGEHAVIDASEAIFADDPAHAWRRARGPGAHPDEWESTRTYSIEGKDTSSRGAFLDRPSYTRLLTYSRLEDLRASNQRWISPPKSGGGKEGGDDEDGADRPAQPDDDDDDGAAARPVDRRPGATTLAGRRRHAQPLHVPWTYFGPGIHFDRDTGRIHIRLSPTAHGVAGLEEYRGPRDPRALHLAISSRADRALGVVGSRHVRVADVGLFHGGDETVRIQGSADVVLDHVEIRAATYGLFIGEAQRVHILHSSIDGGIAPWSFRSDFKGAYKFAGPSGEPVTNNLVRKTQRALLFMAGGDVDVEIAYSELTDGHDVYLAGTRTDFHHNRIHNIHDEALYLKAAANEAGMRIHENVVEQTLSALSFWGKGSGERYVYRNLFDLRTPIAGHRPGSGAQIDTWRHGHAFKNTGNLGTLYFYQNTVLINRPTKPAFLQFSGLGADPAQLQRRWFLNNVFVVRQPDAGSDRAVAFVPPPSYQSVRGPGGVPLLRSDGNVWVRSGPHQRPLFRCTENNRSPACGPMKKVWRLADLRGTGDFEAHSREADDPGFRRAASLDRAGPGDDLRPGPRSPALGQGIALPADLPDPVRPRARRARPDAGALAAGQPLLRVGIDGRLAY